MVTFASHPREVDSVVEGVEATKGRLVLFALVDPTEALVAAQQDVAAAVEEGQWSADAGRQNVAELGGTGMGKDHVINERACSRLSAFR